MIIQQSMFEKLQSLPLLMGLSVDNLMDIVEKVNFEFKKFHYGHTFVTQGEKCDKIIYVLNGSLCTSKHDINRSFILNEIFKQEPYIIEPQNLWGMHQRFERSYSFVSDGGICIIEKRHINYMMTHYDIIKTNFLSMICNKLQYATERLAKNIPKSTEEKILLFLKHNKIYFAGKTEIKIKMQQLAYLIADTRLNVSKVLNKWKSVGIADINRGNLIIYDDTKIFK